MKTWFFKKITAAKSLLAVICVLSLVATGITGCGSSQPDEANTVSSTTGGDESNLENDTQQVQTNVQEEVAYKLPDFDVEEEKPIAVDVDEDWPIEYLLADIGGGAIGGDGSYPSRDGFEVYAFTPENVKCGYDNANGFSIKISDTGSEDWHIQLKKSGVKVENGKWYQVTFDAKSSIDRSIMFSMQRDGSKDEDWRSYSGNKTVQLGNEWKPYTIIFQMTDKTDNRAVYNLSLGSVGGNRIRQQHTVNIKNMKLEELDDTWLDRLRQGDNLLKNPNFEYDDIAWEASVVEPGAAKVKFENGKAVFDISNVGTTDWHVQLKQDSIPLEQGYNYRLTFKASSTAARSINIGFMDKDFVHWYGGSLEALNAGAERTVAVEFYMDKATNNDACMFISMGKIDNMNTPASVITLGEFKLEKLPGRPVSSSSSGGGGWSAPVIALSNGWEVSYWGGEVGRCCEEEPGSYRIDISNTGSLDWHVQMQKKGIVLENGKRYRMSFDAKSSVNRKIICAIQKDGTNDDVWTSYSGGSGQYQLYGDWQTFTCEFTMSNSTDRNAIYSISLGAVDREISNGHSVYLRNLRLEELPEPPIESVAVGQEMLTKWDPDNQNNLPGNKITENNGNITADIVNVGENDYDVQIFWKDLTLEKGCTYEFKCNADFDNGQRIIKVGIMQDGTYEWYGGEDLTIGTAMRARASSGQWMKFAGTTGKEYTFTFIMPKTINNGMLAISMGKIEGVDTPTGTVHLSNISLKKTSEKTEEPDEPDDPTKPIEGNILPELADGNGWALNLNEDTSQGVVAGSATMEYTEDGTVVINISDVGNKAHSVQFALELVDNLKLEEGAEYKVYCDVESSVARPISIMVQKKGGDWSSYGALWSEKLNADTKKSFTFTFTKGDDLDAVFAVNLGKDNGGADTPAGTITLSNIAIVKTKDAPAKPDESDLKLIADGENNLLKGIEPSLNGSATRNETEIEISDVGTNKWDVQLLFNGLTLESGAVYTVTGKIKSSVGRKITVGVQGQTNYTQYGGDFDEPYTADSWRTIEFEVNENNGSYDSPQFYISMGKFDTNTPAGTITISNLSLVKKSGGDDTDLKLIADSDNNLLKGIVPTLNGSATRNDETKIDISDVGSNKWDVQLLFNGLTLESGAVYTVTGQIKSSVGRKITVGVQGQTNYTQYGGDFDEPYTADSWRTIEFEVNENNGSYDSPQFYISMGKFDTNTPAGTITISNLSLVKKSGTYMSTESSDEEIDTLSEAEIETFSLKSVAAEEETVEEITDEPLKTVEEIQEDADEDPETDEAIQEDAGEDPETDEVIQDTTDEEPEADEEIQEDAPNDSVTPETVDTSLNEESNGSDDSN